MTMRVILALLAAAMLVPGCDAAQKKRNTMKELALLDEKVVGEWKMRLRYLPSPVKDTSGWNLVLHIEHASRHPQEILNEPRFSYGLDSLFVVVTAEGEMAPYIVNRMARGQSGAVEYMLTFGRTALRQERVQLRFKDWLFTQRDLFFPLNISSIHQLDSIYTRI